MNDDFNLPPLADALRRGGFAYGGDQLVKFDSVPDDEETPDERRERQRRTKMVEIPPPEKKLWSETMQADVFQEGARKIAQWVRQKVFGLYTRNEIAEITGVDPLADAVQQNEDLHGKLVRKLEAHLGRQPVPEGHEDLVAEMRARLAATKGPRP
jgi:hypothetical protein